METLNTPLQEGTPDRHPQDENPVPQPGDDHLPTGNAADAPPLVTGAPAAAAPVYLDVNSTDYKLGVEILTIMNIGEAKLSANPLSVDLLVNILDTTLRRECMEMCDLFNRHCLAVTYEEIQFTGNALKRTISLLIERKSLLQELTDGDIETTSCLTDNTLYKYGDVQWQLNLNANCLPDKDNIKTIGGLLHALICKIDITISTARKVLSAKKNTAGNPEICSMLLKNYEDLYGSLIQANAEDVITTMELRTNTRAKRSYINKIQAKIAKNPVYEFVTYFSYDKRQFASKLANTRGISNQHLNDFYFWMQFMSALDNNSLTLPWLKEMYHDKIVSINDMLKFGFGYLIKAKKCSPSEAVALLFVWMQDGLKIARSSVEKNVLKFYVEHMESLLNIKLDIRTVQNYKSHEIEDKDKCYTHLEAFAMTCEVI